MADGGNIQFYLFGAALRFGLLHSGLFGLSERPELGYRIIIFKILTLEYILKDLFCFKETKEFFEAKLEVNEIDSYLTNFGRSSSIIRNSQRSFMMKK